MEKVFKRLDAKFVEDENAFELVARVPKGEQVLVDVQPTLRHKDTKEFEEETETVKCVLYDAENINEVTFTATCKGEEQTVTATRPAKEKKKEEQRA